MILRLLLLTLCSCSFTAMAQTMPKPPTIAPNPSAKDVPEDPTQTAPHREMLKEMEIKREERDYKQHIERAKENAQLSAELHEAYTSHKSLQIPDLKKLGRMEKLSRQIRSEAGGEEVKEELKDPPQLDAALKRLVELSEELHQNVEKTPRQIISTAVITQATELIGLIKYVRSLYR